MVNFGVSRELVPGAILQNLATQSIFGFRCSFFVEIEAEIKEISHRKWISKSGVFPGSAFDIQTYGKVLKFTSRRSDPDKNARDGTGQTFFSPSEIRWVKSGHIRSQTSSKSHPWLGHI